MEISILKCTMFSSFTWLCAEKVQLLVTHIKCCAKLFAKWISIPNNPLSFDNYQEHRSSFKILRTWKLGLCSDRSPADPAMTSSSSSFSDPSSYSRPAYWRCPGPGACPGPGLPSAETEASPTQDGMTGSSKCTHSFPQSENTGKSYSFMVLFCHFGVWQPQSSLY